VSSGPDDRAFGVTTTLTIERPRAAMERSDPTVERRRTTMRRTRPSWRIVLGLIAGLCGLVLPWVGLTLSPGLSAWHLSFALGAVPLVGRLTYGEVLAALVVAATVSAVRSGGKPTNTTRACGWALVATALVFVVATRVMGAEILFRLSSDNTETAIFHHQILEYHFAPPTSFLGFTPDATTSLVLDALRLGWYLTLVAGAMLAGRHVGPRRHGRTKLVALICVGVVLAWGFTTGLLAEAARSNGIALALAGRPLQAEHAFDHALLLNPQLRYDSALETELGQAQADLGQQSALSWFAKAASPPASADGVAQQLLDYSQALSTAPTNPVIQNGYASALADDMIGVQAPVDPSAVSKLDDMAFLSFTYGHWAYEVGDDSSTIAFMDRSIAETGNGELQSLAYTYLALSEQQLDHPAAFRQDIVKAVDLDTQNVNGLGREVAAGLYTPGNP
jgi:tetratricopeptide (TPR) repeat protein